MYWNNLFTKNDEISPEEVKSRLKEAESANQYQLLDVRQPGEYQDKHIPGAILIPLKELPDRLDALNPQKTTIVYCRSGARSRAATQLLQEKHFTDVLNMTGGILQWDGLAAQGGENLGLEFFASGTYEDGIAMAVAMENGLKSFYLKAAEIFLERGNTSFSDLLRTMARFEDGHVAKLKATYNTGEHGHLEKMSSVVEGGLDRDRMLDVFLPHLQSKEAILNIAMTFELQAFDMYSRLSRTDVSKQLKEFYLQMADEERKHLDKLSGQLDNLLT